MTELYSVPAQAVLSRVLTSLSGNVVPGAGKHILIACMPKSASTFLCAIIAQLPGMKEVVLTYGHHRREQELCPLQCALFHELNYVTSHHTRYSQATQDILTQFSIFPVILVRNIHDCVVSLRDHLLSESLDIPQAYVPRNFRDLSVERQYDFIIDCMVPWYASFVASWSEYKGPCVAIAYRQLIQDFPAAVGMILKMAGFDASRADIETAMAKVNPREKRFNVGRVGRGMENLSDHQIGRIRNQFSFYDDIPGAVDVLGYDSPQSFVPCERRIPVRAAGSQRS
jgi:hypothetical protein